MTVPVTLNLTIRTVDLDFQAQKVVISYSFSKFGVPQQATLNIGTDFTTAQLNSQQSNLESLFANWVGRQ